MADDEKKATLIEAASNNSVHSNSDLQSWVYSEDGQSVTSLAIISYFLKSRGLKTESELQQMSFLHQYDVMVLQVASRYGGEEEVLRNMTVVHLVKRLEFYCTSFIHIIQVELTFLKYIYKQDENSNIQSSACSLFIDNTTTTSTSHTNSTEVPQGLTTTYEGQTTSEANQQGITSTGKVWTDGQSDIQ